MMVMGYSIPRTLTSVLGNFGTKLPFAIAEIAAKFAKCQPDIDDCDKRSNPVDDISDN